MVFKKIYTDEQRFWSKVEVNSETGCWNWTAYKKKNGYGVFKINKKLKMAHRFSYELFKSSIPKGLELDHLCRNRACINPNHLEPVTNRENIMRGNGICGINRRKTHCINGHEFNKENTYYRSTGPYRDCKKCMYNRNKKSKNKKRTYNENN